MSANRNEGFVLQKFGNAKESFVLKELEKPMCGDYDVVIASEAFGLNFADVMARQGLYGDAPQLPCVLGYECVGSIVQVGCKVTAVNIGDRVTAFSRFGSYARMVKTTEQAVAKIPESWDVVTALACATQGCTAWFAAHETFPIRKGDVAVVMAAAGGVGGILVQLLKNRGAHVIGVVGSSKKIDYVKALGADDVVIREAGKLGELIVAANKNKKIDIAFDNIGGKTFKELFKIIAPGGRIAGYGAADRLLLKGWWGKYKLGFGFGFYNPVQLLIPSKTMAGINMLRIADRQPSLLQECLLQVTQAVDSGAVKVPDGKVFNYTQLSEAHEYLGSGRSVGKIAVTW
jgi:NADPH:quinone reductase-like Zn-dependent oxidoreductase